MSVMGLPRGGGAKKSPGRQLGPIGELMGLLGSLASGWYFGSGRGSCPSIPHGPEIQARAIAKRERRAEKARRLGRTRVYAYALAHTNPRNVRYERTKSAEEAA